MYLKGAKDYLDPAVTLIIINDDLRHGFLPVAIGTIEFFQPVQHV